MDHYLEKHNFLWSILEFLWDSRYVSTVKSTGEHAGNVKKDVGVVFRFEKNVHIFSKKIFFAENDRFLAILGQNGLFSAKKIFSLKMWTFFSDRNITPMSFLTFRAYSSADFTVDRYLKCQINL